MYPMRKVLLTAGLLFLFLPSPLFAAEKVVLNIAIVSDNSHLYCRELLEKSLHLIGREADVRTIDIGPAPQTKIDRMLDDGALSLHWMLQKKARDERWVPVAVDITNGSYGSRILFIPKGQQKVYDTVNTLDDFRNLKKVAAIGLFGLDAQGWRLNNLPYRQPFGPADKIFARIAAGNSGYDYIPLTLSEISRAEKDNNLAIEQRLLFLYDHDLRFYLSKADGSRYKDVLEEALNKARQSGLMETLLRKYYPADYDRLKLDGRIKIRLKTPDS